MLADLFYRLLVRLGVVRSPSRELYRAMDEELAALKEYLNASRAELARDELARRRMRGE